GGSRRGTAHARTRARTRGARPQCAPARACAVRALLRVGGAFPLGRLRRRGRARSAGARRLPPRAGAIVSRSALLGATRSVIVPSRLATRGSDVGAVNVPSGATERPPSVIPPVASGDGARSAST